MNELGDQYDSIPELPTEITSPESQKNLKNADSITVVDRTSAKQTPMHNSPRENADIDHHLVIPKDSPKKSLPPKRLSAKKSSPPKKVGKKKNETVITEHLEESESITPTPLDNKPKVKIGSKFD